MNAEAMRAGRVRQLSEQREQHQNQVAAYRTWVTNEAQAFTKMTQFGSVLGRSNEMFVEAQRGWRELLKSMPEVPPDSSVAW